MEHSNAPALDLKKAKKAHAKAKTILLLQKSAPFLCLPPFPAFESKSLQDSCKLFDSSCKLFDSSCK